MSATPVRTDFFSRRYILHEQLGLGGMGAVYRATDRLTGDVLALKRVFAPVESLVFSSWAGEDAGNEDLRIALAQEFQTLASLRHPHIISVLEYGFDHEQQPYFTMELMKNARSIVGASRLQSIETRVNYLIQTLQALNYLHHRGILHRDLKPGNVLVENDHVKILDFGLAISHSHVPEEAVGTVAYMAPELLEEHPPSVASDLFAVGIMAFEVFAGEHPFDPTGNIMEMIYRISMLEPEYRKLELNRRAVQVIEKLLTKNPQARYQSASDVIRDLVAAFDRPPPAETEDIRESFLQAARLVGRDQELAQLETALDDVMQGQGSAWLIGGESGVGKTRLLEELRVRALVRGAHVLRGEATPDSGLPYQLWRQPIRRLVLTTDLTDLELDILRQIVPDITALLDREPGDSTYTGRQALQDTVMTVLHNQPQPVVLILEDLHWASESLALLKRVSRTAGQFPLLILGSYRNDEHPTLPDELPEMQHMPLHRLNASAIEELSYSMLGQAGRDPGIIKFLEKQTEGNVFFLVEVVRAMAEEAGRLELVGHQTLPIRVFTGGIQAIVQRRLSQVPDWGQPLLKVAAVSGRDLDLRLLEALLPTLDDPPDLNKWLISCANAAVLEVREGDWHFAHDKLREGVVLSIEESRLPAINRQIAEAIETTYPDTPEYAGKLTQHWGAAGDKAKQWHYARLAGQQALEISVYPEAIDYFQQALALAEEIGQTAYNAEIMAQLAKAHRYMGEYGKARALLEDSLALAETNQDTSTRTEALLQLGLLHNNQGQFNEARAHFQQGLELARQAQDKENEGAALSYLGEVARLQGDLEAAINYLQQTLAIARKIRDPRLEGISLDTLGGVYNDLGQYERAIQYRQDALQLFRDNGNRRSEAIALSNLGRSYQDTGAFDQALAAYHQSLKIAQEIGDLAGEGICLDSIGDVHKDLSAFETANTYYERSLAIAREVRNRRYEANRLYDLAHGKLNLGQAQKAVTLAGEAHLIADELGDEDTQCLYSVMQGWAYLAAGNIDQARIALYRAAVTLGDSSHSYRGAVAFGVACLHDDDIQAARNAFNKAVQAADQLLAAQSGDYHAQYVKALALTGLYLCGDSEQAEALTAYQTALNMAAYPGLLADRQREIAELAQVEGADVAVIQQLLAQAISDEADNPDDEESVS